MQSGSPTCVQETRHLLSPRVALAASQTQKESQGPEARHLDVQVNCVKCLRPNTEIFHFT